MRLLCSEHSEEIARRLGCDLWEYTIGHVYSESACVSCGKMLGGLGGVPRSKFMAIEDELAEKIEAVRKQ